ncbi:MAG: MFS transporter [Actinomycetota bacterium]|nr:MFS transporter [Actinomycetota bacterium]
MPAGRLSDAVGPVRMLGLRVAAFLFAYIVFAVVGTSLALFAVAFVFAGVGIGCVETAEHSAVATLAPACVRGSAFGALAAVQSFGNLAASSIAGVIWTAISATAAFAYIGVWMAVALALFVGITLVARR